MAGLLKIGGLWESNDKNGNKTLSGNVDLPVGITINETNRIVIFTNDRKGAENQPDYQMFVTKNEPPEQQR